MKKLLFYASAVAVLFSSCSKDATEDLGTVAGGNKVFTASIGAEETTRLHLNGAQYIWDVADGVGIASEDVLTANIPAYTTEQTSTPSFFVSEDDYRYLFNDVDAIGKALYAYYPYSPAQEAFEVDASGDVTIKLGIPATQRYNGRSFYKTTVNAVGYVEEYATDAHINLTIPTAILNFNVLGLGETAAEGVTLMIKNKYGKFYNLNTNGGTVDVKVNVVDNPETEDIKECPSLELDQNGITETATDASKTTVVFGSVNEPFDYYESIPVAFVVPANLDLSGATFILTNGTDDFEYEWKEAPADDPDKYVVRANSYSNFGSFNVQFGLDDFYVIAKDNNDAAVRDFILYAYATQDSRKHYGTEAARNLYPTEADLIPFVKEMWGIEITGPTDPNLAVAMEKLAKQKLLIACDKIDFENFDAEAMYTKYGTSEYKDDVMAGFYRDALYWYIQNGNAIESLEIGEGTPAGDQAVVGGLEEPTVINGLTVLGNGFTAGAKLENLEITNCKVVSPESIYNVYTSTEEAVKYVGFVASSSTLNAEVENVVLGKGNELIATAVNNAAYIGGIMGDVKASLVPDVTIEALPKIEYASTFTGVALPKVGQLYGYMSVNKNLAVDLSLITSYDVPVIYYTSNQTNVVDFSNGSADATYANVVAENAGASIILNGTSYWNGQAKPAVGGDTYYTAEELAYLMTSDAANTVAMTHNIDMQDVKTAVNTSNTRRINIDNEDVFEISNINIEVDGVTGWVSLLGRYAAVENLTVSNLSINVVESNLLTGVAGLATAGTAKNVTMNGVEINIDKESTFNSNPAYVANNFGGVFTEVGTDDIDNVEVKNINISYAGEANLNARVGIIAGTMNVATTSKGVTLKPFAVGGVNAGVNVAVGQGPLNNATKGIDGYKTINNYGTKYKSTKGDIYAFGTVNVTNAAFAVTRQEAKLNLAAGWDATKPFAAGIVFNDTFTAAAAGQVLYDAANVADYDYTFFTNAPLATGRSVWGFNKK